MVPVVGVRTLPSSLRTLSAVLVAPQRLVGRRRSASLRVALSRRFRSDPGLLSSLPHRRASSSWRVVFAGSWSSGGPRLPRHGRCRRYSCALSTYRGRPQSRVSPDGLCRRGFRPAVLAAVFDPRSWPGLPCSRSLPGPGRGRLGGLCGCVVCRLPSPPSWRRPTSPRRLGRLGRRCFRGGRCRFAGTSGCLVRRYGRGSGAARPAGSVAATGGRSELHSKPVRSRPRWRCAGTRLDVRTTPAFSAMASPTYETRRAAGGRALLEAGKNTEPRGVRQTCHTI